MEKLNELAAGIKSGKLSAIWVAVNSEHILTIAEAFRELEQRAEEAESKLAELVPDEMTWNQAHSLLDINQCGEDRFSAFMMGANYNRSLILRKIDEMK